MSERISEIIQIVKEMGEDEKLELIHRLIGHDLLNDIIEDVEDLLLFTSRRDEPAEDFEDFLKELRDEGRPV